jgi:hypothetical protein
MVSKLRNEAKRMFERKQRFLGWLQREQAERGTKAGE